MSYLEEVKITLKQLKPELMSKYGVSSLGLFGSIVRDDFTDQSDIDILVTFSKPIGVEFIDLADELEEKLNRRVDLVSRNGIKPRYYEVIEPEILYV
ncbi:nucleotidyltransferase family protein [Mucilaginibacter arboris]|uniref:DNA polymerase subunit beta n=1 Tax=Mucilaginibacter arboris TaxID=2682090 RepID=A0A7K1SWZ0_9SPHI|nr:nucleotidyltransferase family protein [Mucilaginibacter arboris]MVN21855.1 DNA polymerase subunit beta [Mucilaginibacter arboris]